jgi:hypothetical protein
MKRYLILLFLLLLLNGELASQQPVPYQDVQATANIRVPVQESNKDFNLWYIIGAFATAISFLATMYIRTHGQLMAEKDKMLSREIERNKEERQYDTAYDEKVKDLLSKQQRILEGIEKSISLINENLTHIRIGIKHPKSE